MATSWDSVIRHAIARISSASQAAMTSTIATSRHTATQDRMVSRNLLLVIRQFLTSCGCLTAPNMNTA